MSWNDGKDDWGPFRDAAIPAPRTPSPWELDAAFVPMTHAEIAAIPHDELQFENYAQTLQTYWAAQRAWSRWRHKRRVITESLVVAGLATAGMFSPGWSLLALPAAFFALLAIRTWWHTDISRTTGAMLELDLEAAEQAMFDGLARRLG